MSRWKEIKKAQKQKQAQSQNPKAEVIYSGYWSRILAMIIDIFMIGLPISFIIMAIFGYDQMQHMSTMDLLGGKKPATPPDPRIALTQTGLYALVTVLLWKFQKGQTPGKKQAQIAVVDAKTLQAPSTAQLIVRFFSYFLTVVSVVGIFMPLMNKKHQALHDWIAGTVVIYQSR